MYTIYGKLYTLYGKLFKTNGALYTIYGRVYTIHCTTHYSVSPLSSFSEAVKDTCDMQHASVQLILYSGAASFVAIILIWFSARFPAISLGKRCLSIYPGKNSWHQSKHQQMGDGGRHILALPCTVYSVQKGVESVLYTVKYTLYTVESTLYRVQWRETSHSGTSMSNAR